MNYAAHEYELAVSDNDYLFAEFCELDCMHGERAHRILAEAREVYSNIIAWASRD